MSAALAYLEDEVQIPRPARHLYLVAVDGRIVERATPPDTSPENRSRTACVRTGTSALPLPYALGNITGFTEGGTGIEPVTAQIDYTNCTASHIVGKPWKITVNAAGREMRRREGDIDCATGNLNWQRAYIDTSTYAETTFNWDEYGNLFTIVGAPNRMGQQMTLAYIYDAETNTYPARIDNVSYGIHSTATYDSKWGKPLSTTDTNGNVIAYTYDSVGVLSALSATSFVCTSTNFSPSFPPPA